MADSKKKPRSDRSSINYRWKPNKGVSFELADFVHKGPAPSLCEANKHAGKKREAKFDKILSTTELISAVGQIWNHAKSLAASNRKVNLTDDCAGVEDILSKVAKKESYGVPLSADSKYFSVDLRGDSQSLHRMPSKLDLLKATRMISLFQSGNGKYTHSRIWKLLDGSAFLRPDEIRSGAGPASVGVSYEFGEINRWMTEAVPAGCKHTNNVPEADNETAVERCISRDSFVGSTVSGDKHGPAGMLAKGDSDGSMKGENPSSSAYTKLSMNGGTTGLLVSNLFLNDVQDVKEDKSICPKCSSLHGDYCIKALGSCSSKEEKCIPQIDSDVIVENKRTPPETNDIMCENEVEFPSPKHEKTLISIAKQEHAFAGALAGVFVSLCLHPLDTIKTVIQSCHAEQKSICYIGKSIVSERGFNGLYRGISSKIASSAPISAIYTFSYESVKGALLPHFPKEFHSLAHCMAGGCASIATSFIFTPSEHIKQQMQIGSHYHNSWNALIRIIGKGGLPSLYAGWGAVLCRNVPHSIIKFYTYESLKQMMLPSAQSAAHPNTIQTLVCGGLAGSTAALFTTPFDVVKTRLQTQIPGSASQYRSVFHALQEIAKQEGLIGLYRGLIPRLVIYMTQGALFFASYEFFKRTFSLDVSQCKTHVLQRKENQDVALSSQSPITFSSSSSASPNSKFNSLHP